MAPSCAAEGCCDDDDFTDPNSPNFVDPNDVARWCGKCNLVDTGDSEYVIDMPDLMAFVTDGYWLWTACWKQSQMDRFENIMMMAMGDGGEMSIFSSLMELESSFEPESISGESTSDAKLSTQEFVSAVISIQAILRKTDQLLEDGGIDTDELRKTQEILTDFLLELNESRK